MKVLIAEDDPISRVLLSRLLVKAGYEVVATANGSEAWEVLRKEGAPRLAVLDWMMPGMDGLAVCQRVRTRSGGAYTYILLLTSKDATPDVVARGTRAVLEAMRGRPGHVFNLGHGLTPGAKLENISALVQTVRSFK